MLKQLKLVHTPVPVRQQGVSRQASSVILTYIWTRSDRNCLLLVLESNALLHTFGGLLDPWFSCEYVEHF